MQLTPLQCRDRLRHPSPRAHTCSHASMRACKPQADGSGGPSLELQGNRSALHRPGSLVATIDVHLPRRAPENLRSKCGARKRLAETRTRRWLLQGGAGSAGSPPEDVAYPQQVCNIARCYKHEAESQGRSRIGACAVADVLAPPLVARATFDQCQPETRAMTHLASLGRELSVSTTAPPPPHTHKNSSAHPGRTIKLSSACAQSRIAGPTSRFVRILGGFIQSRSKLAPGQRVCYGCALNYGSCRRSARARRRSLTGGGCEGCAAPLGLGAAGRRRIGGRRLRFAAGAGCG